jgi:hypothetical protein
MVLLEELALEQDIRLRQMHRSNNDLQVLLKVDIN